jgi:ferredoxin
MAVKITDLCINCDACVEECPATAIISADDSPVESDLTYVRPERCIECVDCSVPKCVDVCPTEGALVWDMPYTLEFNDYYKTGNESGEYAIREHKKKGVMLPEIAERPFRESITMEMREAHEALSF